jgi:ubiquitin C-terminal hydrolase
MAAKKASKSTAASKGKAAAKVAPAVKPVATEVVQAPARPLPGLKNMGNTCWLNAVMQALTHCQFLADAVENSEHHSRCAMDKCVLCNMEAHLRCARHSTAPFISPDRIVNTLPLISSTLMRGRQEDAHEFLRTLVCSMQNALTLEGIQSDDTTTAALAAGTTKEQSQSDDEASQVSGFSQRKRAVHAKHNKWGKQQQQQRGEGGGSSVRGGKGIGKAVPEEEGGLTDSDPESESVPQNSSTSSSSSSSATAALSRDRRYPFSLFSGAIQNQVRCGQCKKLSSKQDPIEDLELEISRSSSLENALVQFCAEEELAGDNAYHCDRCKTKVAAMRRIQLHKVPPVLTVSFKRFAVNGPYASGQGGRTSARAAAAAAAAAAAVAPVLSPPPQGSSRGGLWGLFSASKSEGGANNNPAAGGEAAAKSKYDTSNSSSHNGGKMASSRPRGGLQKIQHYVHYPEYVFCSIPSSFSCV